MISSSQLSLFSAALTTERPAQIKVQPRNFQLAGDRTLSSTWGERTFDNIAAIDLMQTIIREGRHATPEEQERLIRFIGFGSTAMATSLFPVGDAPPRKGFEKLHQYLTRVVDEQGMRALRRSTQYAHYTPEPIIREMWSGVRALGFNGGSVLEPGCGVGLFLALMPHDLAERSRFTGIEHEPITAQIASLLYPLADIRQGDFTDLKRPLGPPFDLAIGNPPFNNRTVRAGNVSLSLHEFFIHRSLQNLKPGSVAAFVVSRYLMDKGEPPSRAAIEALADFIGAVRLPAKSMAGRAGTDVVVDLVFFRRRHADQQPRSQPWQTVSGLKVDGGTQAINEYFIRHPEQALGTHAIVSSQFGPAYSCLGDKANPWIDRLGAAIERVVTSKPPQIIPENITAKPDDETNAPEAPTIIADFFPPSAPIGDVADGVVIREGSYVIDEHDALCRMVGGRMVAVDIRGVNATTGITRATAAAIRGIIPIRDALRAVLLAQEQDRPWQDALEALRQAYAAYTTETITVREDGKPVRKIRGPINETKVVERHTKRTVVRLDEETGDEIKEKVPHISHTYLRPNLAPFMLDPDVWLVAAVEDYDLDTNTAQHGPVFRTRVVRPPHTRTIKSAADALAVCLNELGKVDIGRIAELLDRSEAECVIDLGGLVYEDPETGDWQTADEYLSGSVRKKLALARQAAEHNPDFTRNVDALIEVQPPDLKPSEISVRLGAPWIAKRYVQQFGREELGLTNVEVRHNADLAIWDLEYLGAPVIPRQSVYGTLRRTVAALFSDVLNSKLPKIYDTYYEGRTKRQELNVKETEAAKEKLHRIKVAFEKWVWRDADRASDMVRTYNERYNDIVPRSFDGSHLTLPGASMLVNPRPIQRSAAWQAVCCGSNYVAHKVGYGKTISAIIAVMEQIRLGMISKPIITVPGHTLGQWAREWMMMYPSARILVADEANMDGAHRLEFFGRATTGTWDAIICTHEAFKKVAVPAAYEATLIEELVDQYEEALSRVEPNDRLSRKRLESLKEKQGAKLSALRAKKDDLVTFATLGVDYIVVDEAHAFKKLSFATNMTGLLGIDPQGSQRAWDLFVKTRFLHTTKPNRTTMLLSGTPITNTMGELFNILRILDLDELKRCGLHQFDPWASTFCDTTSRIELQPSGKFKPVTRMARFVNVPELMVRFRQRANVVQSNANAEIPNMPKLRRGKRTLVAVEPSPLFRKLQESFAHRLAIIETRKGPPKKGDDIILSVIHDGRLVAGDVRMMNPTFPNEPFNKLNRMVRRLHRIWKVTSGRVYINPTTGQPYPRNGAAQMVFIDLGTPGMAQRGRFSPYVWAKEQLIAKGVPESEIAFIHDYPTAQDKLRLRQRVDAGFVRFIFGSTLKMGTGINFQLRLIAEHHFDCPWLFADLEQREGRIDRFGNQNRDFRIYVMATKGSMDATMFGACERKLRFVRAALQGDRSIRIIQDDDSDVAQLAIAKAIASGDDRLMKQAGLQNEVGRLERLLAAFNDEQYTMRYRVSKAQKTVHESKARIPAYEADCLAVLPGDPFLITVNGEDITDRREGGVRLISAIAKIWMDEKETASVIGSYRGLPIHVEGLRKRFNEETTFAVQVSLIPPSSNDIEIAWSPKSPWNVMIDRLHTAIDVPADRLNRAISAERNAVETIDVYSPRLTETFDLQAELDAKSAELFALNESLARDALSAKPKPP